ncbi:MAG: hypothetical protein LQ346_003542 [Caloplaca aetnensis]|nr:MAG: hypothetical protein LQ346_003542 [Caloplaca aetnensis]
MPRQAKFSFSTVTGYFLQDDDAIVAKDFDYVATNFGLINRTYVSDALNAQKDVETQWQRFEREVERLNAEADERVVYKVLYLGRHGQGVHNVAEQRYGRTEWDVSRLLFDIQLAFSLRIPFAEPSLFISFLPIFSFLFVSSKTEEKLPALNPRTPPPALLRRPRGRHPRPLGRRAPHPPRRHASPRRPRLLGPPACPRAHPGAAELLRQPPPPLPRDGEPHFPRPGPAGRPAVQARREGAAA